MIVIPLMIGIQILKDLKWLDVFTGWMAPVTRGLGMNENTALVLTAGLIFGLAYGAGVLLQAVKEDGVSKKMRHWHLFFSLRAMLSLKIH